jgi:hypothetical protein
MWTLVDIGQSLSKCPPLDVGVKGGCGCVMSKNSGGGEALASVELGGGEGAIQVSGNLGLAVSPIYICTLKPPFLHLSPLCICLPRLHLFLLSLSAATDIQR